MVKNMMIKHQYLSIYASSRIYVSVNNKMGINKISSAHLNISQTQIQNILSASNNGNASKQIVEHCRFSFERYETKHPNRLYSSTLVYHIPSYMSIQQMQMIGVIKNFTPNVNSEIIYCGL